MSKPLIAPEIAHLSMPITEVELWPNNPRRGDVGAISESLKRFGQVRPILVQKSTNRVVAGNHVLRAAAALGWTEIAAVIMDMGEKQAKAYVAADNRVSELGDFDEDALARLLADIAKNDTLEGTGYDADDLDALLAKVGNATKHGFGDPDGSHAVPEEPWVKDGQIFQLGPHRIACGLPTDALLDRLFEGDPADLLVVTPPHGSPLASAGPLVALMTYFGKVKEAFWVGAERYIDKLLSPEKGSWIVWDKRADAFEGQLGAAFELIWTKQDHKREILRHSLVGAADGVVRGGPDFTERPSALYMDIYERYSRFESIIADPYSVGATALLAAEKTGRVWYGCKAEPAHTQSVIEKFAEFSGMDVKDIEEVGSKAS